jgi:hypothetical protein
MGEWTHEARRWNDILIFRNALIHQLEKAKELRVMMA